MKKLALCAFVVSLAACGGGGSDGSSPNNTPTSSTTPGAPTVVAKPLVDYFPYFFPIGAGSYNVLCGPDKSSKTYSFSTNGVVSPWIAGGVLDLRAAGFSMSFERVLVDTPTQPAYATFGAGGAVKDGAAGISFNSDGTVVSGQGGSNQVGLSEHCEGASEAAPLKFKSAYTAFAKVIDAKKTALRCINPPNDPNGVLVDYEVAVGELTLGSEKISMLSGLKKEFVGQLRNVSAPDANGVSVDRQSLSYSIETTDARVLTWVFNEYGDLVALNDGTPTSVKRVCYTPV